MYQPTMQGLVGSIPDTVLVLTEDGFDVGRYHGVARPESESYQIHIIDPMTGREEGIGEASLYHKEDLYDNTQENVERLKSLR